MNTLKARRVWWEPGYPKRFTRNPQNPKTVPFHKRLPLELSDKVSGKSDRNKGSICLQEISLMFTCLKDNDGKDGPCAKEITDYNKCFFGYLEGNQQMRKQLASGIMTPNTREMKKLNHHQVNNLLKKFPQTNIRPPKS